MTGVLLLAMAGGAVAQRVQPLRFTSTAEIAPLMLSIPVPSGAREVPRKPVAFQRYRLTSGSRTWFEDRADARDFWTEAQFAACWVDPRDTVVTLALMETRLPSGLAGRMMTRDAFEAAMDASSPALDRDADDADLAGWMADFCGLSIRNPPRRLPINTSRLARLFAFDFDDSTLRAYAFRLNAMHPGQARAPDNWFALILHAARPLQDMDDYRIERELLAAIKTTSAFEGTRAGRVPQSRFSTTEPAVYPGPVRDRMRRSIQYLSTWWSMESPHYIMLSDHPNAERFALDILGELEAMRPYYEAAVPPLALAALMEEEVGVVRLFQRVDDYLGYVGDTVSGMDASLTGGVFDGARRELVIRPSRSLTAQAEGSLRSVIKHEGFHQYVFSAFGGLTPSAWLNEGFAVFFEQCEVDRRGGLQVNESRRHAETLERLARHPDIDWARDLPAHMMLGYADFYADPEVNYAIAWGLVYYLIRGAPMERNQPYAGFLPAYREAFERTADPDAATEAALASVNLRQFARSFSTFWRSVKSRQDARRRPGL